MNRNKEVLTNVRAKFEKAKAKFRPDKGNDAEYLEKCSKHLACMVEVRSLLRFAKENLCERVTTI